MKEQATKNIYDYFLPSDTALQKLDQRIGLIRTIAILLALSATGTMILGLLLALTLGNIGWMLIYNAFLPTLFHLICIYLAKKGATEKRVDLAAYLQVGTVIISVSAGQFSFGSNTFIPAMLIVTPLLAGVDGLKFRAVLLLSALASVPLLGLFILEEIGKAYQPVINLADYPIINFGFLVLLFVLVVVIVIVFISRINKAVTVTEQQAQHLQEAFTALNSTHNVSKNLSHELTSVSTEISVNSQQHAHNFNEQVAAINQVTASLSELTETANQIASRASASDQSVGKAVAVAKEVEESSKQAQLVVQEGREAINRTVYNMSRLSQRIEQLAQNLLQLTSQAKNVGNIVSIINSISDEIHLLALNASIEAGGASQMGASVQGERFAVIAQEVKNLADRSRESTNEIEQTTKEIIGAIAGAVLIAEESRKETAHASAQSAMAGKVIEVLYQTIERNAIGTDQILKAFDEFIAYTEEIHLATHQQQSATSQILTTMNTISQVSRENSLAVSQISEAINRVSQQAHQLNQTLEIARN